MRICGRRGSGRRSRGAKKGPGVARCEEGVKREKLASPSAVAKARLGTTSDLVRCLGIAA